MPYTRDITADDEVFFDTDMVLRFAIYAGNPTAAEILLGTAAPVDVAGWALTWVLRSKVDSEAALISKSVADGIVVVGTFNASASLNTQRVEVTLKDTDTYDPDGSPPVLINAGNYVHALKRTDPDSETVLTKGKFKLLRAAAWE